MRQLGFRGRAWLKYFHILCSALWSGSVVCMLLLTILDTYLRDSNVNSTLLAVKLIDDYITAPFAVCSLLTGFLFSLLTNWGFFKYKWVIVKWVLTFTCIFTGVMWLNPHIGNLVSISKKDGSNLTNATFLFNQQLLIILLSIAVLVIILIFLISVFKPWRKAMQVLEKI